MGRPPAYRRSSSLIAYWDEGRLVVHNYHSGARVVVHPSLIPFLHDFDRVSRAAGSRGRKASARLARTTTELARHTLLEAAGCPARAAVPGWDAWAPLAAAFHFGTKDLPFSTDPQRGERRLARVARRSPMPPPAKQAERKVRITPLPAVPLTGEFVETLLDRRTWRDFGRRKVTVRDVAALLRLTWGVQRWGIAPGQGRVALKTSPSGGACHPGEVYVLAVRIDGLAPGLYHYESHRHRLALIRRSATPADIGRYLPGQPWYRRASALFLMTAVFERAQWRYPTPRAYRTVLVDAGHLCQTFCLTASWLKLAPFCSMALADSIIERDLGIDGESEGVLYAAGVGSRAVAGWRPGVPGVRRTRRTAPSSSF
ncbi:MAG: SagB family peptide dehydrogenase [Vicinamibacterales bacterium]